MDRTPSVSGSKLSRSLGFFDVYAVSLGAMFSSGFFLLPGIAAAITGPSVSFAYLMAGVLIIPAMLSMAELSTAMPRAGGAYYVLDRSMGPMIGTIGGLGSWVALVFKSAFALVGMGAYIGLFLDVPIIPLAIFLTIIFGILNIFGAKETSQLQRIMVSALILILGFYLIQGVLFLFNTSPDLLQGEMRPLFKNGIHGFMTAIGVVFVSYAGLTKVASISEEVDRPGRNIPMGMIAALITASIVYGLGVYLMSAILNPDAFYADLTPVATSGEVFMDWLPQPWGLILIMVAAVAAFASTGNAGIMSASRYPLAMARDGLMPAIFSNVSKRGTPTMAIVITVAFMIILLLAFQIDQIAKLASAFQLMLFGMLNLAVLIMRESRIRAYEPEFKSPLYPWIQIAGILISVWLVTEMGLMAAAFTGTLVTFCIAWYFYYARKDIGRRGAIYHIHARLGEKMDQGLDWELKSILRERGLDEELEYEETIAGAHFIDLEEENLTENDGLNHVAHYLAGSDRGDVDYWIQSLRRMSERDSLHIHNNIVFMYAMDAALESAELILLRSSKGIESRRGEKRYRAMILMLYPDHSKSRYLRIVAHLAGRLDEPEFLRNWLTAEDERSIKSLLLREDRFTMLKLDKESENSALIGREVKSLDLIGNALIAVIHRDEELLIAKGDSLLREGDIITIIGDSEDITEIRDSFETMDEFIQGKMSQD